jgi:hypothetical protein
VFFGSGNVLCLVHSCESEYMTGKKPENERLSLHGMTPEEVIERALAAGSPKQTAGEILAAAFEEFAATSTTTAKCDSCGSPIEFRPLSERAWESRCKCGKFNDTLRGL